MRTARTTALTTALTAALLALAALPSRAGAVDFSPDELARLKAGKVVRQELPSSRQGGFYGGSGYALIDAPVDAVWKALQDWGAYTKIFPNTTETTELSRKGGRSLIKMRLGHPVVSITYHVEMSRDEEKKILSFELAMDLPHDLDGVRGYWRLFPQSNDRTLIAYVVAINAPMGLVNLAGPELSARAIHALLGVPGYVKKWVEGEGRSRYAR
jgi:hypothetical protein